MGTTKDDKAVAEAFGARLRALAARRNLTRPMIAKVTGASYSTAERWWKGESVPRIDHAAALAAALGCTLNDLAGLPSDPTTSYDERVILDVIRIMELSSRQAIKLLSPDKGETEPGYEPGGKERAVNGGRKPTPPGPPPGGKSARSSC